MARGAQRAAVEAGPVVGPWELPAGWRWERLGSLGDWYGGGTPSKANSAFWTGGNVPWVSAKDMKSDYIDDTDDHITDDAILNSAAKRIPSGSVLCVMRSGILKHSLPVAVTRREVTINQDLRAVHPSPEIEPAFLAFYLRRVAQDVLHECSKDGTTVNSIEAGRLMQWPVPVPNVEVQRRIVGRIEELFGDIAEGEQALCVASEAARTHRMALERALLTGGLVEAREHKCSNAVDALLAGVAGVVGRGRKRVAGSSLPDDLPPLPVAWRWVRLADLICEGPANGYSPKASSGATGTYSLKLTATSGGLMRLDADCIKVLNETIEPGSPLFLQPGDVLFQRGNTRELVGIAAMFEGPEDTYIYPDLMIRVRTPTRLLSRWLWRWANSPSGRRYMMDSAQGAAGSMPKISGDTVRNMPVPVGPPQEMARALETLDATQEADVAPALDTAAATARSLRQTILAAAFRGDLVA